MEHNLAQTISLLTRTPAPLNALLRDLPEQVLPLGPVLEVEQPEVEEGVHLVPVLDGVVVELAVVLDRDRLAQVRKLCDDLRVVLVNLDGLYVFDEI